MSRKAPLIDLVMATVLAVLAGCGSQDHWYLGKKADSDFEYYKGAATEIEYPDVDAHRLADVEGSLRPISLQHPDSKNFWDLSLEKAMEIALRNNKVMRNIGGQVQGPPDFLIRNPDVAPTIYDVALAESNPRTGPEAALAAFDAQLNTSLTWEYTDAPQNAGASVTALFPNVSEHDLGTFQARLQKTAVTGGTFALTQSTAYDRDRYPYLDEFGEPTNRLLYPAVWNVKIIAELRQPLLQGAGTQFNRIAGPGATPGVYNGVVLARIRTDIVLTDFEMAVQNLVSDVEVAYWELYFQYRSYDAVIAGRDSALSMWRKIYTLYLNGSIGGEAEKEAQAREQYYLFRSTAEQSLNALYATEAKFRYLLGLAPTDGRLIRPKDEPTTAKLVFDWHDVLGEGLVRNVALRQEKWIVKTRELELIASKNFLLPKLDFVAQYRWLGMGNRLDGTGSLDLDERNPGDANAYRTLFGGQYQESQVGFVATIPIGFRKEMAGVTNAQLALTKEHAKLQEGELELAHQLAYAVRDLETNYVLTQTDFNRRLAADRQVQALLTAYDNGKITLYEVLTAQQQLAQAESDYYRVLVNYNKSIAQVHYRKGSLLEYNGVYLAEGPWPGKAYFDARRRARARAASTPLDYGFTQPRVLSRGPIEQRRGETLPTDAVPQNPPTPAPGTPEPMPTPAPDPKSSDAAPEPAPSAPQPETAADGDNVIIPAQAFGRSAVEKGSIHETGKDPSAAATDRFASGGTRL
jgi:outer membrane protein TolC